jgi:hypothetical protein
MPTTSIIYIPNGESTAINSTGVVRAQTSVVQLLDASPLPGGSPINADIKKFPRDAVGLIRIRVGMGGTPNVLTLKASSVVGGDLPRPVTVNIAGPGDVFWPATRKALATALKNVSGGIPNGTVAIDLLKTEGVIAQDGELSILGIIKAGQGSIAPGQMMQVITSGPAFATCDGGWAAGDALCAAASGALRAISLGETGVDQVAIADADQDDEDTGCPVTVSLLAL